MDGELTIQSVTQTAIGTLLLDTHGRLYALEYWQGEWLARPMTVTVKRDQPDD